MIDRIVFGVELAEPEALGQPRAANERSEPGIESCPRLAGDGQQLAIPPQVFWPPFDLLTRNPDGAVIVEGLQRAKAPIADVQGFGGEFRFAQMTLQSNEGAHTASA